MGDSTAPEIGSRVHCKSRVEMVSAGSGKPAWVLWRGAFVQKIDKSPSCPTEITCTQNQIDKPPREPFVCTGLGGWSGLAGAPGLCCLLEEISVHPPPIDFLTLLCVHKHTAKRCERFMMLPCFCSNKKQSEW